MVLETVQGKVLPMHCGLRRHHPVKFGLQVCKVGVLGSWITKGVLKMTNDDCPLDAQVRVTGWSFQVGRDIPVVWRVGKGCCTCIAINVQPFRQGELMVTQLCVHLWLSGTTPILHNHLFWCNVGISHANSISHIIVHATFTCQINKDIQQYTQISNKTKMAYLLIIFL